MSFIVSANENIYHFDDISVDVENFCVQRNGQNIPLTPKGFDVLAFLLKNHGRVVEKQELFNNVWKGTFVGDNALTKIVKEIRQALRDSADEPRYIETIPKRGYRFIGELESKSDQTAPETGASADPRRLTSPRIGFSKTTLVLSAIGLAMILALSGWLLFRQMATKNSSSPIHSIAVLPFKPLNAESRNESLEMGMAETLITRLSNLKELVVRPMNAVRKYTDLQQDPVKAGQEVQAEAILDGSIQKVDERVRVTVRLIDVTNGGTLWSEQFDENFTDIFKVQDSIAERVTNALTIRLSKQEKEQITRHLTDNPEAYQLYLQGQFLWNRRQQNWLEQSLAAYQQALEKDPNFALAHIGVADSYIMMSGHRRISMQEAETKAWPSIMKALQLDNSLAQAHNALAELKYQYQYDWSGAEKEFKTAIELNPNIAWIHQAYGWFLMSEARFDEANVEMERARELDPSSLTINVGRGRLYYYSRQYDKALQNFQNILEAEPAEESTYNSIYQIYEQKQMYPEAFEAYLKLKNANGAPSKVIDECRKVFRVSGWPGVLRKQLESLREVAKNRHVDPSGFVSLYARLGQKEEAFTWLEKTFVEHDPAILQLKVEPAYDNLRDDPRYAEMVRRIGLQF